MDRFLGLIMKHVSLHPDRRRRLALESLEARTLLAGDELVLFSGRVFADATGDGYTAGEEVAGATLTLYRDNGNGMFDAGGADEAVAVIQSTGDGTYRFPLVGEGVYFVEQPQQTADGQSLRAAMTGPFTVGPVEAQGLLGNVIDSFDQTTQVATATRTAGGSNPDGSSFSAPEALGGERDLFVELQSTSGRLELLANETTPGMLEFGALGTSTGIRWVTWDGIDGNAEALDPVGLGRVDLTDGGSQVGLRVSIGSDHDGGSALVRIHTDANHWTESMVEIPNTGGGADGVLFVSFADDFLPAGPLGGADFTNVGAIRFELSGVQAIDGQLDMLAAVRAFQVTSDFSNPRLVDLELTKSIDNAAPNLGDHVTFTVRVQNRGPDTAHDVAVRDVLPHEIVFVGGTADQGSYDPQSGLWQIGTVAAGAAVDLVIEARVTATETRINAAEIVSQLEADADSVPDNADPSEDDRATVSFAPQVADLSLNKSVSDSTPAVGETVVFTVTLRNDGPSAATGVSVLDRLPAGLVFVSAIPDQGQYSMASGVWNVGSVSQGEQLRLRITATVAGDDPLTNSAEIVAADQHDVDSTPANNLLSEDDQDRVTLEPQQIDLSLSKTVDSSRPRANEIVTFRLTVRNDGDSRATGVVVTDLLPSGLQFVSSSGDAGTYEASTGMWQIGTLAAGADVERTIAARVVAPGRKENRAEITEADQQDVDSVPGNSLPGEDDQDVVELIPLTSVRGHVFVDRDNDGLRTTGESGVEDVQLALSGLDDEGQLVSRTVTTGEGGAYRFDDLPPSHADGYTIAEVQPENLLDGKDRAGTLGGVTAAISSLDRITGVVVRGGEVGDDYDFGELISASIAGSVYVDLNNDGARQVHEPGIANVRLALSGHDDLGAAVGQFIQTDDDGRYVFQGLRPSGAGGYVLSESQPRSFLDGKDSPGTPYQFSPLDTEAVDDAFAGIGLASGTAARDFDFGELAAPLSKRRFLASAR
jgi:uncharacterized repeat protein (TIGR01451 family)